MTEKPKKPLSTKFWQVFRTEEGILKELCLEYSYNNGEICIWEVWYEPSGEKVELTQVEDDKYVAEIAEKYNPADYCD